MDCKWELSHDTGGGSVPKMRIYHCAAQYLASFERTKDASSCVSLQGMLRGFVPQFFCLPSWMLVPGIFQVASVFAEKPSEPFTSIVTKTCCSERVWASNTSHDGQTPFPSSRSHVAKS